VISKAHIAEWRAKTPWAFDPQVEQDLVISRALVDIYADEFLRTVLAFRGRTALHKLYFDPPERYSEDIDLVRLESGPIKPVISRLRERLEPWLGQASYKAKDRTSTLRFRFDSESTPPIPLRLKVEINVRETFALAGVRSVPFRVATRWFTGSAEITTFTLEELMATKLRALHQRSKGRDAFDLDRGLQLRVGPSPERIVDLFQGYLAHQGVTVSRAQFEENLHAKRRDVDFLADIAALLATTAPRYDALAGLERVAVGLVQLLPGEPWAGAS
jgi:predicted nucleotidyltransferase component of viral defense system